MLSLVSEVASDLLETSVSSASLVMRVNFSLSPVLCLPSPLSLLFHTGNCRDSGGGNSD